MLTYISVLTSGLIGFCAFADVPSELLLKGPSKESKTVEEALLSIYPEQPLHISIKDPMPHQECEMVGNRKNKREQCGPIEYRYEDNPDKFNFVLAETEAWVDTSDSGFLATPLGRRYSDLKKFMNVYNQFDSCAENDAAVEEDGVAQALMARLASNISNNLAKQSDCRSAEEHNMQMIFDVIQAAHTQNTELDEQPRECAVAGALLSGSLRRLVLSRVNVESRFNTNNFNDPAFAEQLAEELCIGRVPYFVDTTRGKRKKYKTGNVCTAQERSNIQTIIEQAKAKKMGAATTSSDSNDSLASAREKINQHLAKLNDVLQKYDQKRKELLAEKEQRFSQLSNNRSDDRVKWRISNEYRQKMNTAKQEVFADYQMALAELHKHDLGFLLHSPSLKKATGLDQLEEFIPKHFGLSGVQEEVLSHRENFPVLQPVSNQVVQNAVKDVQNNSKKTIQRTMEEQEKTQEDNQEYLTRLAQVPHNGTKEELDEWYKSRRVEQVEHLIMTNPDVVGPALIDDPQYSGVICQAVKNIEEDEERYAVLKKTLMVGAITGALAISVVAPFVGVIGLKALLVTTGIALTVTGTDIKLRLDKVQKHRALQEEMLSAYLAGVGDDHSIEQIRTEWRSALTEDIYAKWIGVLVAFDITRTGTAVRKQLLDAATAAAPSTRVIRQVTKDKTTIESIAENPEQYRALEHLMATQSHSNVREFFRTIALYPKDKKTEILEGLPDMAHKVNLDLRGLTSEFRGAGIRANIKAKMGRFVTCATCKVKPSVKIKQRNNDNVTGGIEEAAEEEAEERLKGFRSE